MSTPEKQANAEKSLSEYKALYELMKGLVGHPVAHRSGLTVDDASMKHESPRILMSVEFITDPKGGALLAYVLGEQMTKLAEGVTAASLTVAPFDAVCCGNSRLEEGNQLNGNRIYYTYNRTARGSDSGVTTPELHRTVMDMAKASAVKYLVDLAGLKPVPADMLPEQAAETAPAVLEFNAFAALLLAPFIAKNDVRYYLNGLHIEPHYSGVGVVIVATNGHRMACFYDKAGFADKPYTINWSSGLAAACKLSTKEHGKSRVIHLKDNMLFVSRVTEFDCYDGEHKRVKEYEHLSAQCGKIFIEGKFPDYMKVIPDASEYTSGLIGGYNQDYIKDLGDLAKTAGKYGLAPINPRYQNAIYFYSKPHNENGIAIMRIAGLDEFIALIMPMRLEKMPDTQQIVPSFLQRPKQQIQDTPET